MIILKNLNKRLLTFLYDYVYSPKAKCMACTQLDKGPTIQSPGGGGYIFKINNFGGTLREINNLLQELLYIKM